jgi:two-component system, NarL family, sensor kinase
VTRAGAAVSACFAVWFAAAAAGLGLTIATWGINVRPFTDAPAANVRDIALCTVFAAVGVLLAAKRPRNVVGWLLLGVALSLALNILFVRYAVYGLLAHPGSLPGATVAAVLGSSAWVILLSSLVLLFLTFPNGHLPSRRWWIAVWGVVVIDGLTWVGNTLVPGPLTRPLNHYDNPIGIGALHSLKNALSAPGFLLVVIFAASAVSLVQRFRHARGEERQQYKWFTFAAALFPVAMVVTQVLDGV